MGKLLMISGGIGLLIGLAACLAFGVLDVQCNGSPEGRYWNAARQQCQATEVGPANHPSSEQTK